jgi:phosphoenolpyruvate-protein kinase (PTS system EI component)
MLDEVISEMKITDNLPLLGIMVEVPSVALTIERFLPEIDFICLGTNDLLQFFFAVNRAQADLRKYNRFTHPAFLKMLEGVIVACKNNDTPCTVCGEMASDPIGCGLLAALGATVLSIQPDSVQNVRHSIAQFNVAALQAMLPVLFDLESADEVERKLLTLGVK